MKHKEMAQRIYEQLPKHYRNMDVDTGYQLKRYLQVLTEGGIGPVHEDTRRILSLLDYDNIPGEFLPLMAAELGFEFPYDLDEQTQRVYVKSAVQSYKSKGTARTLEFMLRELTRFKTELRIDEEARFLDIRMEVDIGRQDFDNVVNKVDFLVKEYAPPLTSYRLTNTFVWSEDFTKVWPMDQDIILVKPPMVDIEYEDYGWFRANISDTNDFETVTYSGETYFWMEGHEEVSNLCLTWMDEEALEPRSTAEYPVFRVDFQDADEKVITVEEQERPHTVDYGNSIDYRYEKWELETNNELTMTNSTDPKAEITGGEDRYTKTIDEEYTEKITYS